MLLRNSWCSDGFLAATLVHRLSSAPHRHNRQQHEIVESGNSLFREFVLRVNLPLLDRQCDCLCEAEDLMQNPPNFARTSKPHRSEIGQFNKSATTAFLDQFDQTLARDKRRFPKRCGFAWFLLEQMLPPPALLLFASSSFTPRLD